MTMNGASRHTACKSCRDRKVRCGGEQPSCTKCTRAGEECIYLPTQRPTRADLTQTVGALQKRLYEAEARISRMTGHENGTSAVPPRSPPSYAPPWPTNAEYSGAAAFHCPLPPFMSTGPDAGLLPSQPGYAHLSFQSHNPASPGSLNNDFLDSLQPGGSPQTTGERNDSMHLGRDDDGRHHASSDVDISATLAFASFQQDSHHQHAQGYTDVTAPSTSGGSTAASSSSVTLHDGAATARGVETSEKASAAIATLLAEFSAAVFHSQAEIAGMSLAVADYIAWMRKVPTGIAPPNTSLVYVNVLEAVENRLREMREIAQTRPRAAFRDMVASLQAVGPVGHSVCNSLSDLEKEFDKRSADVASFFQTRYNACAALSEQAQNIPHASAARKGSPESAQSQHR